MINEILYVCKSRKQAGNRCREWFEVLKQMSERKVSINEKNKTVITQFARIKFSHRNPLLRRKYNYIISDKDVESENYALIISVAMNINY